MKQALEQFLSLKATFDVQTESILQTSDIALVRSTWKLIGTAPDGQRVEMANRSIEVVRKQNDGTWKYVIDNPFGVVYRMLALGCISHHADAAFLTATMAPNTSVSRGMANGR